MRVNPSFCRPAAVAIAAAALACGLFLGLAQAAWVIRYLGYWFLLITFAWFAWSLFAFFRGHAVSREQLRGEWKPLLVIPASVLLLLLHEPFVFKVLADELVLLATSLSMHLDRQVFTPFGTHDLQGAFTVFDGYTDKRPGFFPFLLCLVHDLTGYRPANAFALNALLTAVFLSLVYGCGRSLAGKGGAVVAVLLMAGLPLVAQNATSGGFDVLNLVMLAATLLLGMHFWRTRSEEGLTALCFAAVLLAQSRYESVLFIVAVGLLILLAWLKERRVILTWPVVAVPFLLVPNLLQYRLIRDQPEFWSLPENLDSPFSLGFFHDNFGHALNYLFDFGLERGNSPLLSVLGLVGLIFFIFFMGRHLVNGRVLQQGPRFVLAVFGAIICVNFVVLLCYHWGQIDSYEVSRLSLPFHFLLVLAGVFLLGQFAASRRAWTGLAAVAAAFILSYSISASAKHTGTMTYIPSRATEWARDVIRENQDRHYLYIMRSPVLPVVYERPGISIARARDRQDALWLHLDRGTYEEIVVFQIVFINLKTGHQYVSDKEDLGEEFVLETIRDRRLNSEVIVRFSRVVAVNPAPYGDTELPDGLPADLRPAKPSVGGEEPPASGRGGNLP